MASRGSKKANSEKHENFIANIYGGRRSASSGAAVTDGGDVTDPTTRWECKYKGSSMEPLKKKPVLLTQFEGIADEAWEVGLEPAIALRFYWPESILASPEGNVDFSVRLTTDDAVRDRVMESLQDEVNELETRVSELADKAWKYDELSK